MSSLSQLIKRLERKHGHGANSPEHSGGAGQGAAPSGGGRTPPPIVNGLAKIFSAPGDGASIFPRGKAPPPHGIHILAAGNRANAAKFGNVYDAHGLWTNDDGKQFVEPSFFIHAQGSPQEVLRDAEALRRANKQESVGVVWRGHEDKMPPGFQRAHAYRIHGSRETVELIDPEQVKLYATKRLLGGKGVQIVLSVVGVKWLNGDDVAKAKKPRKQKWGLSDEYMPKMLDKMIDDLGDPLGGIFKALEGEQLWTKDVTINCSAFDRDGEVVVECTGGE